MAPGKRSGPAGNPGRSLAAGHRQQATADRVTRRKRLSADLPQHWLHHPGYWALSDAAWRMHTHSLMWAIGRTDGFIPDAMLPTLLAGTDAGRAAAAGELADAGLWAAVPGGWQVCGWEDSQSTVAQIEANRERERDKKRRKRASVPGGTPGGTAPGDDPGGVRHGKGNDKNALRGTENFDPQPQAGPQPDAALRLVANGTPAAPRCELCDAAVSVLRSAQCQPGAVVCVRCETEPARPADERWQSTGTTGRPW